MNKWKYTGLVLLTTFLMGSAFPVGKIGLAYAPPFLLMGIRFVLAGGLMAWMAGGSPEGRRRGPWAHAALIGCFQSAGVMGCAYFGMRWISSGEMAILTSVNPLLVIVFGSLLNGTKYRSRQWIGVIVGFVGILVAFGFHVGLQPGTIVGFAGAVCFAIATLLTKRWGAAFDSRSLASSQMLYGGIALLLLSAFAEHPRFEVAPEAIVSLLWLVLGCSILQFALWYDLLSKGDPGKTSAFLFLVPLFGLLTSWLLLGEQPHDAVYAGCAIVGAGIVLVNREGGRSKEKALREAPALESGFRK